MAGNDNLKVVFGSMTLGEKGKMMVRISDHDDASQLLDIFQKHGGTTVDSARLYAGGTTEAMLGDLNYADRGLLMDTKLWPSAGHPQSPPALKYWHTPEDVRRGLKDSLAALKTKKLNTFYLHAPDRKHSFVDALQEVNKLHEEGFFDHFGISNFQPWEVALVCETCHNNQWIQPTVYQGMYHALQRRTEAELFPCLRHYGMSFYAYSPLGGGFLTGRYKRDQTTFEEGSRFEPSTPAGKFHQSSFWKDSYFDAIDHITAAAEKHNFTLSEVALRWLKYHSVLSVEKGDGIILGVGSVKHLEGNFQALEKPALPEDVVKATDEAWAMVKGAVGPYTH
ncbi:hypothetical protein LTR86_001866 [Recurvomyces mirabilis]|nr:hypothetical protein LTR86_001866 [Recurvomyces mirabilis]